MSDDTNQSYEFPVINVNKRKIDWIKKITFAEKAQEQVTGNGITVIDQYVREWRLHVYLPIIVEC